MSMNQEIPLRTWRVTLSPTGFEDVRAHEAAIDEGNLYLTVYDRDMEEGIDIIAIFRDGHWRRAAWQQPEPADHVL